MNKKTIAFVGLGAMGSHSARLLATAGFRVHGFDLRREALDALSKAGGHACSSPAEAACDADCALLFVVNGKQPEAHADPFIAVPPTAIGRRHTYAQLSTPPHARPTNPHTARPAATMLPGHTPPRPLPHP